MFENLRVQVEIFPAGTTGLLQPVDVGINKPLKDRICKQWQRWMLDKVRGTSDMPNPSHEDLACWVIVALEDITVEIVQNSWLHKPFNWF